MLLAPQTLKMLSLRVPSLKVLRSTYLRQRLSIARVKPPTSRKARRLAVDLLLDICFAIGHPKPNGTELS